MKDKKTEVNESAESLDTQIEIVSEPEDVDEDDIEAIQSRIAEIDEIDFSATVEPQRELLKFEKQTLQATLEAYQSVLETEGGEDDE